MPASMVFRLAWYRLCGILRQVRIEYPHPLVRAVAPIAVRLPFIWGLVGATRCYSWVAFCSCGWRVTPEPKNSNWNHGFRG